MSVHFTHPFFDVSVISNRYFYFFLQQNQFAALNAPKKDNSQIEGASIANSYGFKISMQNLQDAKALHEVSCKIRCLRLLKVNSILILPVLCFGLQTMNNN